MNKQGRRAAVGLIILACCLPVWALGLDEVQLNSRLNQPVQFTLDVLQQSKTPVAARHVQVSIASASVYQQRGLAFPSLLNDINLEVIDGDRLQIQGRSTLPLREPVLHLLFNLQWPGGSAVVQRSVIVELSAQHLPETAVAALPVAPTKIKPVAAGERTHRVRRGEVLSLIASDYRGSVDIPLHRYMRAIQRLNRQAFPQGLDQLSPGQAIRMPDPQALLHSGGIVLPLHGETAFIDYEVQYGDKLSLLADHFRANADMPLQAYMQQIVDANTAVLDMSGVSLKSGMLLRIPNPVSMRSDVAAIPEPSPPLETAALVAVFASPEPPAEVLEQQALAQLPQAQPVKIDINAYRDTPQIAAQPVAPAAELDENKPLTRAKNKPHKNALRQWIIVALWLVLLFIVVAIVIAVVKAVKKNAEPLELAILPSLLPEQPAQTEDLQDHDSIQDSIALLDVETQEPSKDPDHQATLRMHADDYLQQKPAAVEVAKFSSAEQNEIEKLIAADKLTEAAKKADQLIYSQSGDLKNWLLKLEVLAKQGKKERCYTLAAQVRGSFKAAAQQLQVDQILDQYFSGAADADEFVPEDYNPDEAPRKKSAAAELASETAEVRVYISYGFYDMAEQALEKLMQNFPRHIDLRILNLEVLLGTGNEARLQQESEALLQGASKLSQAQEYQVKELLERAQTVAATEAAAPPAMDFDLSEPSQSSVELDFSADEMAHLDVSEVLDLEGDIADALHREEDAQH